MNAQQQIANYLQIDASAVTRCEEWANVWFVVIAGRGARFVTKKAVKKMSEVIKKFPVAPAKVHSAKDVKEFEDAISLGAGRIVTWQAKDGECVAKIDYAFNGMQDRLHYVLPNGQKMDVPEFLEKIKESGVDYEIKHPLTKSDYLYV